MKSHKVFRIFLVTFLLTTLTATTVFASTNQIDNGPTNTGDGAPPQQKPVQLSDEALEAAADVLGISADELSEAMEDGSTLEELAEEAGVELDDAIAAIQNVMPEWNLRFAMGRGGGMRLMMNDEALDAAADLLGITVDELSAALEEGTTIEELAETAGVDFEDVMTAIMEGMPKFGENLLDNEELLAEVADLLGMTEDELTAALEDGSTLMELAEDAGIDMKDLSEVVGPMFANRGGFFGGANMILDNEEALAAVADLLGMTSTELTTALEDGSILQDLVDDASLEMQDIMDAISEFMPAGGGMMPQNGTPPNGEIPGGGGPGGQPGQAPAAQ